MAFQDTAVHRNSISTNSALAHRDGTLTDETLLLMTDEQLERLAYTADGTVSTEHYRAPMIKKKADEQGHSAGSIYLGVHRALLVLDQRRRERIADAIIRRNEDEEALASLTTTSDVIH